MTSSDAAVTAMGLARCEKPERYIKQLVSHWSHKMATSYDEGDGVGSCPFAELGNAAMTARPEGIASTRGTAVRVRNVPPRGVIEPHIDRFAFREAPLTYEWTEQ